MNDSTNHIPDPSDNQPTLDELLDKLPEIRDFAGTSFYGGDSAQFADAIRTLLTIIDALQAALAKAEAERVAYEDLTGMVYTDNQRMTEALVQATGIIGRLIGVDEQPTAGTRKFERMVAWAGLVLDDMKADGTLPRHMRNAVPNGGA